MRQQSWTLGRIAAKRTLLLCDILSVRHPREVTIATRDPQGSGMPPRVRINGRDVDVSLSISHTSRGVLVGVSRDAGVSIGVDLVPRETLGTSFQRLWFTDAEQTFVRAATSDRRDMQALFWGAKEAVYKTLGGSAPFAPREIEIVVRPHGTMSCRVRGQQSAIEIFHWRVDDHVACAAVRRPVQTGHQSVIRCDSKKRLRHDEASEFSPITSLLRRVELGTAARDASPPLTLLKGMTS
ncbi:MAG: 4-phosphopantetheinyl transferase family protein [Planctomycetaceae bacterium]|nr:4-phosphopantetheinyl transferase family protein [Planctomycetaceae bacterium]